MAGNIFNYNVAWNRRIMIENNGNYTTWIVTLLTQSLTSHCVSCSRSYVSKILGSLNPGIFVYPPRAEQLDVVTIATNYTVHRII